MSKIQIEVLENYRPLFIPNEEDQQNINFLLISGRIGGKTYGINQICYYCITQYQNLDIQVLRANSSSMKESTFTELKKFFFKYFPFPIFSKIKFRETPPLLITMPWGNQIRFGGVGLGSKSGSNISRGKIAERKLSLIVFEETQEIFSGLTGTEDFLNQAKATFIRNMDEKVGKIVYAGNVERNINAKFNIWCREREKDKTFTVIRTDWRDIRSHLTRLTVQMIENEAEMNPRNYQYMFLGIPVGGTDLVYGAFTETIHCVPMPTQDYPDKRFMNVQYTKGKVATEQINRLFIGVDHATTHDEVAFVPIFNFKSNKLLIKTSEMLIHDPKRNGIITNSVLSGEYVTKWFYALIEKYNLWNIGQENIIFVVDGHAEDLRQELIFHLGEAAAFIKFTNKDLVATSDRVNNAFVNAESGVTLYVEDGSFIRIREELPCQAYDLINEFQTVCWREDIPTEFNKSIKNDKTDAIRYAVSYYANPENVSSQANMRELESEV